MPRLRATHPETGKSFEFDWDGGPEGPNDQELDEIWKEAQAPAQSNILPGLKLGVEAFTAPMSEYFPEMKSVGDTIEARRQKVLQGTLGPTVGKGASLLADFMSPGTAVSGLGGTQSILDMVTAPAGISSLGTKAPGGIARGSRLLEVAAGMGIGAEGLAEIKEAIEKGDWKSIPGGVIRAAVGGLMAKPQGRAAADAVEIVTPPSAAAAAVDAVDPSTPARAANMALDETAHRQAMMADKIREAKLQLEARQKAEMAAEEYDSAIALAKQQPLPASQMAPPSGGGTPTPLLPGPAPAGPTAPWMPSPQSASTGAMPGIAPQNAPVPPASMVPASEPNLVIEAGNLLMNDPEIKRATSRSLAKLMGIDPKTAHETLEAMAQLGIVEREGVDTYRKVSFGKIPLPVQGAKKPPIPKAEAPSGGPLIPEARTGADDLATAAREAEEAVTSLSPEASARLQSLNPPAAGMTRLYRGEGPLSSKGSNWYTTEAAEAGSYAAGGKVQYTDVPTERLEQLNVAMGRDPSLRGEFQLPEGYVAQSREIGPKGTFRNINDPQAGAVAPDLPKTLYQTINRGVGDFMRASVAGDIPTAIRNVYSGLRMVGQAMIENPIAAAHSRLMMSRAKNPAERAALERSSRLFTETAKAFPKATFEEGASTLGDALRMLSGGRIDPKWGDPAGFAQRLSLMESVGDKKLAKKLGEFSNVDLQGTSGWRRGLMFFNILGDRFINKTFLKAHVDAAQKVFGAANPAALEAMAARNPAMKQVLNDYLIEAGSEAFRASWQNTAASGYTKTLIKALDETPAGLIIQPFAKAFLANTLPNIAEKIPGIAFASKRVRNSFTYQANKKLVESLKPIAAGNVKVQKQISRILKENRELAEGGIYNPSKIAARQTMGAFMMTAAVGQRLMRGDDGTEFDETPVELNAGGQASKVANFSQALGEDLPFWYIGDRVAHHMMGSKKYEGKDGIASLKQLGKAVQGSRYGVSSPFWDLIGSGGKDELDVEFIDRTVRGIAEDLGRMSGAGSWAGGTIRRVMASGHPEDAANKRADVVEQPLAPPGSGFAKTAATMTARAGEGFKKGAQAQVPVLKRDLPDSIAWSKLKKGSQVDPLEPTLGGSLEDAQKLMDSGKPISALLSLVPGATRSEVSELDRFANAHQGKTSLSQILPRRTQEPAYDELVLRHLKEGLEKKALPLLRSGKIQKLSDDAQVRWFESLSKVRDDAKDKASRDFKRLTGHDPIGEVKRDKKEKEEREKTRSMRRELRSLNAY